ncbi:hypothetical protein H9Q73_010232 [Fusarium xylarioides]|nr:hypothetical protein H9Q73_010232 [Fusarium xylarioides]
MDGRRAAHDMLQHPLRFDSRLSATLSAKSPEPAPGSCPVLINPRPPSILRIHSLRRSLTRVSWYFQTRTFLRAFSTRPFLIIQYGFSRQRISGVGSFCLACQCSISATSPD